MRVLLNSIILFILILSATLYATPDSVRITFDGKAFTKPYPTNYNEAVSVMKSLVKHCNKVDSLFTSIDKDVDSLKTNVFFYDSINDIRLNSISNLLIKIDSLNKVITNNNRILVDTIKVLTDSVKKQVDKIDAGMNKFNIGASLGVTTDFDKFKSVAVSPMLIYRRVYGCINGGLSLYSDKTIPFIGISAGLLIK